MYFFVFLFSLGIANTQAQMSNLLPSIKDLGEKAERARREAEERTRKEREELERAAREAFEKAKTVVEKVKSEIQKETTRLVEEAVCSVRKAKSGELVSGVLNIRKGSLTLKLGNLLNKPIPGEDIALKFKLSKSDHLDSVDYEVLDLNHPENDRWGILDFAEEGLQVQCDKQIRTEILADAQAEKWVNDLNLSKTIPNEIRLVPARHWVDRLSLELAK